MYIYIKMSIVTLAYNRNDFFYATSYNTPSDDTCAIWKETDASFSKCAACYSTTLNPYVSNGSVIINNGMVDPSANGAVDASLNVDTVDDVALNANNKCDMSYWNDMSSNCFKYQLCKNKELATLANSAQNKYGGSDERYANIKKEYDYAVLHTVNIVTGIIALGGLTVYYFSK